MSVYGPKLNQPSKKRFAVRRVIGSGDLWVTEYILTYDGKPSYTVSIMEFSGAMREIRDGITTSVRFNAVVGTGVPGFIPRAR